MDAYSRLARLPAPRKQAIDVGSWVQRIARLETRLSVRVEEGPRLTIEADPDQLDQLLINLLRNAVDAALETDGGVRLGWCKGTAFAEVWIQDDGPGLPDAANLFVPFFTTKPKGSGIGLVLCRQIAEAHGGNVTLQNGAKGCEARLRLPLA